MNLSKRIWRDVQQLKEEMEVAMTVAIGEGKSAASMSRKVRQYLNDPDLMFRRFRYKIGEDENGNPIYGRKWKKRVIDPVTGKKTWIDYDRDSYKTGRGVYKSAAKNAMRVTRTETNMAYRRADYERWQQMDFVLGIRIELSNQHPVTDICDFVQGDYPKDFVFEGWHPQCFCYATPILISEDEMAKVSEAFANGKTYTPKGKPITDTPKGFKKWVKDHKEQIQCAKNLPYWVRDNKDVVNEIWGKRISKKKENINAEDASSTTNSKSSATRNLNKDIPHKAVKKVYNTNAELDETFKEINSEFTNNKWFENGELKISVINKKGKNGETNGKGYIGLTAERLDRVKIAMGKIGQGKSSEITFNEADAMATFWHEITHNRSKQVLVRMTDIQRDTMEMMNEFVARKTLPEFYKKLGCAKMPYSEFVDNRMSTGYNRRVLGYDFIIQKLGLDPVKVLESAKQNLFILKCTKQSITAEQALIDGGLDTFKRVDGKPIGRAQLLKIVTWCRKGTPIDEIEDFMRKEGIIK